MQLSHLNYLLKQFMTDSKSDLHFCSISPSRRHQYNPQSLHTNWGNRRLTNRVNLLQTSMNSVFAIHFACLDIKRHKQILYIYSHCINVYNIEKQILSLSDKMSTKNETQKQLERKTLWESNPSYNKLFCYCITADSQYPTLWYTRKSQASWSTATVADCFTSA